MVADLQRRSVNILINDRRPGVWLHAAEAVGQDRFSATTSQVTVVGVLADFKVEGTVGPIVPTVYYQ